jgi:RNA polymerase sigma-70 factor, ECF subfamily
MADYRPPQPIEHDPDYALIQGMAARDSRALDELYERHGRGILSFLVAQLHDNRQLAEEVLQDVMLAAWENAGNFRGESKVRTWLLVIARNRALNAVRRRSPLLVELNDDLSNYDDDTSPLERVQRQFRGQALRKAIENLPPQHKEILVLVFYQGLSGAEVAQVLGISEGTVKSRLHRAKEALRRLLQLTGEMFDAS